MDPKEWGRGFWAIIWIILYDVELFPSLTEVKKYIDVITRNLPCDFCKSHVAERMQKYNIMSTESRDVMTEFFLWVYSTTNESGNKFNTRFDKFDDQSDVNMYSLSN